MSGGHDRPSRRTLAIFGIEVPSTADWIGTIHQDVETSALPAIEVLHPQGGPLGRPRFEFLCRREEELVGEELDAEAFETSDRGMRTGSGRHERGVAVVPAMVGETCREALGPSIVDRKPCVTEFIGEVPHGGHDQMGSLSVPSAARQHGAVLDEEHPA